MPVSVDVSFVINFFCSWLTCSKKLNPAGILGLSFLPCLLSEQLRQMRTSQSAYLAELFLLWALATWNVKAIHEGFWGVVRELGICVSAMLWLMWGAPSEHDLGQQGWLTLHGS